MVSHSSFQGLSRYEIFTVISSICPMNDTDLLNNAPRVPLN